MTHKFQIMEEVDRNLSLLLLPSSAMTPWNIVSSFSGVSFEKLFPLFFPT